MGMHIENDSFIQTCSDEWEAVFRIVFAEDRNLISSFNADVEKLSPANIDKPRYLYSLEIRVIYRTWKSKGKKENIQKRKVLV